MSRSAVSLAVAAGARRAAETAEPAKLWAPVLAEVPLFSGLSKRHVRRIADRASESRFPAGATIVREGSRGQAFYVILDGDATVTPPGGRRVRLRSGDFFGEMALLDGGPRSATVVADSEVLALKLDRSAVLGMLRSDPEIALGLLRVLAARVRSLEGSSGS